METLVPTMEEFRRLYEAALAFKQLAPWQWLYDDQIFGVVDPDTGEIGYVSIMGRLGEHLALALYLGSSGLNGYYRLAANEEPDNADLLLEIRQLQASFEDREILRDQDRQVIKALGLKFRGRQEWPLFRSYVPGCLPWFVTPAEARFLTVALEQALEVTTRLREDPSLLGPQRRDVYLARVLGEQGWVDKWVEPAPFPIHVGRRIPSREAAALRKKLATKPVRLEIDLYGLCIIREEEEPRPYLGYNLLIVECEGGFIAGGELLVARPSLEVMWDRLPAYLVQAVNRLGIMPAEVNVRTERLASLLGPVCEQLGIRLLVARRLPTLDEARRSLDQRMW